MSKEVEELKNKEADLKERLKKVEEEQSYGMK